MAPLGFHHHLHDALHAPSASDCPEHRIDIPILHEPDVDRLLEPHRAEQGTLRCRVRRMRDKGVLELFLEEGNVFLLSATKQGKEWVISEGQGGSSAQQRSIVRLRAHKDRSFTCVRARDQRCDAPPELMLVRHSTVQLSEDLPELNTMQSALPRPPAGALDAPSGMLAMRLRQVLDGGASGGELTVLESRRPKWNSRTETYELPFGGRANWASARNFQLVERCGAL